MSNTKVKVNLELKYLKSANKTDSELICLECEREFLAYVPPKAVEIKCPHCGAYDTEPV